MIISENECLGNEPAIKKARRLFDSTVLVLQRCAGHNGIKTA